MDYDLLIKNGQTVDGMPVEIAIKEKKIALLQQLFQVLQKKLST